MDTFSQREIATFVCSVIHNRLPQWLTLHAGKVNGLVLMQHLSTRALYTRCLIRPFIHQCSTAFYVTFTPIHNQMNTSGFSILPKDTLACFYQPSLMQKSVNWSEASQMCNINLIQSRDPFILLTVYQIQIWAWEPEAKSHLSWLPVHHKTNRKMVDDSCSHSHLQKIYNQKLT